MTINNVFLNYYNNKINTSMYGQSNGVSYPVLVDSHGRLYTVSDNTPSSAFGELTCAFLFPVTGWTFNYTFLNTITSFTSVNAGTYSVNNSMITISTGTQPNARAKLETNDAVIYSPGTGILVRFTAIFTLGVANSTQLIGIGDDTDGFYFGYNGTSFGVLRRRGGVDTWTPQSSWNVDKLDGTGTSAMTLNTTKGNVYSIQYQWLGFGAINFYVENPIDGALILANQIKYANSNTLPSLFNPTLPLMAEVKNTGNSTNVALSSPSAMAFAEGSYLNKAISARYSYYAEQITISANTLTTIFSIRNKSTFNGKTNKVKVVLSFCSASTVGNKLVSLTFLSNPTFTGGTFTDISANQSVIEYSTNATYTGGTVSLFLAAGSQDSIALDLTSLDLYLNPNDSIVVRARSPQQSDISISLSWFEYY